MSRGPGQIEQRIGELFATTRDRALSITDITAHVFALEGAPATRAQRLSATRAAHRLLRRAEEVSRKTIPAFERALEETRRILGRGPDLRKPDNWVVFLIGRGHVRVDEEYARVMKTTPSWPAFQKAWPRLRREIDRFEEIFGWCMTETAGRRIRFHPGDYPARVWAVSIQPAGVIWADTELINVTDRYVMVRYAGAVARLGRLKLALY
jgi:hypothetical protein